MKLFEAAGLLTDIDLIDQPAALEALNETAYQAASSGQTLSDFRDLTPTERTAMIVATGRVWEERVSAIAKEVLDLLAVEMGAATGKIENQAASNETAAAVQSKGI